MRIPRNLPHHLLARITLSPPPLLSAEAQWIYDNFKQLAPLELFRFKPTLLVPHGEALEVVYAPSYESRVIGNLLEHEPTVVENENSDDAANQLKILDQIKLLVAIPRYPYIEDDDRYFDGKVEVPFAHNLAKHGAHLAGTYELTHLNIKSPFIEFTTKDNRDHIRKAMRHNFTKFHKFADIKVLKGVSFPDDPKAFGFVDEEIEPVEFKATPWVPQNLKDPYD